MSFQKPDFFNRKEYRDFNDQIYAVEVAGGIFDAFDIVEERMQKMDEIMQKARARQKR